MTRKSIILITATILLVVGLIAGGFARTVPRAPASAPPANLWDMVKVAKASEGEGLALNQEYHQEHIEEEELACSACHRSTFDPVLEVFSQDLSPQNNMGPVDRTVCLGCHVDGDGPKFYGFPDPRALEEDDGDKPKDPDEDEDKDDEDKDDEDKDDEDKDDEDKDDEDKDDEDKDDEDEDEDD